MEYRQQSASCPLCKLADICIPFGLKADEIKSLTSIVKDKPPFHLDEYLYHQGDTCQSLYAIKSGSFKSIITNAEGDEQIIGFHLPGELLGLDSLQNGRFSCSTIALETAAVCELPLASLNELCAQLPGLQQQMTRILGKEIATVHDKIVLLGHRSAKERFATFLLMLSHRYANLGYSGIQFSLSMRRQDIANFLGLTNETVSRQIAELAKSGVVDIKQREVIIRNLAALEAIIEPCLPISA